MFTRSTLAALALITLLGGCAYQAQMRKGDDAAAQNNWPEAYKAYEAAFQKNGSDESRNKMAEARTKALQTSLQDAELALQIRNYEEAWQHLDHVQSIDPKDETLAFLRGEVAKQMMLDLTERVSARLDMREAYSLASRAKKLLGTRAEGLDGHLETLRAHFETQAQALMKEKKYVEARAAAVTITEFEADQSAHVQALEHEILTKWADDLSVAGAQNARAGRHGVAAVQFARAYEIAGRPDDLAQSRSSATKLKDAATVSVYFETTGGGARASTLREAVRSKVEAVPDVSRGGSTTSLLKAQITLANATCTESAQKTEEEKPYISGTRQVPNPRHAELTELVTELRKDVADSQEDEARLRPDVEKAKTALADFDKQIASKTALRTDSERKLKEAEDQLQKTQAKATELEGKIASLEAASAPSSQIQMTQGELDAVNQTIPKWQEKADELRSGFDKIDGEIRALSVDREPASDAASRLQGSYDAIKGMLDKSKAELRDLEAKLANTPKTLTEDIPATLEYTIFDWTRTCSAPVTASYAPKWTTPLDRTQRLTNKAQATDRAHIGHEKAGVTEDPKKYPKTDAELTAEADAATTQAIVEHVTKLVDNYYTERVGEAVDAMGKDDLKATEIFVGLYVGARGRMAEESVNMMAVQLKTAYGLEKLELLKAE